MQEGRCQASLISWPCWDGPPVLHPISPARDGQRWPIEFFSNRNPERLPAPVGVSADPFQTQLNGLNKENILWAARNLGLSLRATSLNSSSTRPPSSTR